MADSAVLSRKQDQLRQRNLTQFDEKEAQKSKANVGGIERVLSVAGGGALAYYGATRKEWDWQRVALVAGGADLLWRGLSGRCWLYSLTGISTAGRAGKSSAVVVTRTVTINQSPNALYDFWRDVENQPKFAVFLESVLSSGGNRSHWVAKVAGAKLEWDSEATEDRGNHRLEWQSLPGSDVGVKGEALFLAAPGNRGTEVTVTMAYEPPAGKLGAAVATFIGANPEQQLRETLRRFKELMEAGEIATIEGQASGRGYDKAMSQGGKKAGDWK